MPLILSHYSLHRFHGLSNLVWAIQQMASLVLFAHHASTLNRYINAHLGYPI